MNTIALFLFLSALLSLLCTLLYDRNRCCCRKVLITTMCALRSSLATSLIAASIPLEPTSSLTFHVPIRALGGILGGGG